MELKPDVITVEEGTEKTQDKLGLPNSKHELYEILSSMESWNQDWVDIMKRQSLKCHLKVIMNLNGQSKA